MAKKQLLVLRPDFKPRGQARKPLIAMSALHQPVDLARGIRVELRFHQIKINSQLAVDFSAKPVLDDLVNDPSEDNEHDGCGGGVPEREPKLDGAALPPASHADCPPSARSRLRGRCG